MSDDFENDDPNAEVVSGDDQDEEEFNEEDYEEILTEEPDVPDLPPKGSGMNQFQQKMLGVDTAPGRIEYENFAEFCQKAEDCKARGDTAGEKLNRQRAESWRQDFEALGQELKAGAEEENLEEVEKAILRAQKLGADVLDNPKLHGDARQLIHYFNRKSDAPYVYLDATVLNESQEGLSKEHTRLTKLAKEASKGKDPWSKIRAQEFRSRIKAVKEEMKIRGSDAFNGEDIIKVPLLCGGDSARSLFDQFGGDQKKIVRYLLDSGQFMPLHSPHLKAHQEQRRASRPSTDSYTSSGNRVEVDEDGFEIEVGTPAGWEY